MLPVDEIMTELRAVLEDFEKSPDYDHFDTVQRELTRIRNVVEDLLDEESQ